jgi:hypothetical protein
MIHAQLSNYPLVRVELYAFAGKGRWEQVRSRSRGNLRVPTRLTSMREACCEAIAFAQRNNVPLVPMTREAIMYLRNEQPTSARRMG